MQAGLGATDGADVQRIDDTVVIHPTGSPPGGFETFYEQEYRRVVGITYALTGSWPAAEDIAQEAFIVAHDRWTEVSGFDLPGAWVTKVATNKAVSWLRRRRSEIKAITTLRWRRQEYATLDTADHEFWAEVRKLPANQATAITLHYLDDRPVDEIAEILDCAPSTARVHLHRGRKALAASLDLEVSE